MNLTRIIATTTLFLLGVNLCLGQQKINVYNSGNTMYGKVLTSIDSIKLDGTYARFKRLDSLNTLNIQKKLIDSLTFTTSALTLNKIYIIYNGTDNATIINPYATTGVNITATAGTVVVAATSGIANLEYNILGSTTNGSLTLATDKDVTLVLNNLTLTNPSGAAITVSGAKTTNFLLASGTTNTLTDGTASTKNGTITTDGPITISNPGALTISGVKRHGINTSSSISILNGTTTISAAASDGLHSEGYSMSGGTATITSLADGIDAGNGAINITGGTINVTSTTADVKAIKTGNGSINIASAAINLNVSGAQSKAISAKGNITFNSGTFTITVSGATVLAASGSGYDPSYATAVKSDSIITVNGGTFNIQTLMAADGGKGFSANGLLNITGGNITINTAGNGGTYTNTSGVADSYSVSGISSDTTITISGGTLNLTNTGADGKGISGNRNVVISGTAQVIITNSGGSGKGIKADGNVTFNGGTVTLNVSGATILTASGSGYTTSYPTGVKAANIVVNNGTIVINGTTAATGAKGFSSDGSLTVNGGNITATLAGAGTTYTNALGLRDSYAASALSADGNIVITSGTVTTTSSGAGGKGLNADGTITIGNATSSPTLNIKTTGARFLVNGTDYSHPKTIVANKAIIINNGVLTINSTDDGIHSDSAITINGGNTTVSAISATSGVGEGIEAPLITIAGGVTNVTASNDGINTTYGTVSGGTESNDGSNLFITGGILIAAGSDAIDCNGNLTITGGTTIVCGPSSQPEEGIDYNGTFNMNGGFLISGGSNANMTKAMSTTSTQRGMYLKSSTQLAATSMLHIENASGTEMVTYKPKNGVNYFHFSSPSVAAGTQYKVYFGGAYNGGNFTGNSSGWGLYNGGAWSNTGATLKSTLTTSTTSTVTTVSF